MGKRSIDGKTKDNKSKREGIPQRQEPSPYNVSVLRTGRLEVRVDGLPL